MWDIKNAKLLFYSKFDQKVNFLRLWYFDAYLKNIRGYTGIPFSDNIVYNKFLSPCCSYLSFRLPLSRNSCTLLFVQFSEIFYTDFTPWKRKITLTSTHFDQDNANDYKRFFHEFLPVNFAKTSYQIDYIYF